MPHERFRRKGSVLRLDETVPFSAMLGSCTTTVQLLNGDTKRIAIPALLQQVKLPGEGMPDQNRNLNRGGLIVGFHLFGHKTRKMVSDAASTMWYLGVLALVLWRPHLLLFVLFVYQMFMR